MGGTPIAGWFIITENRMNLGDNYNVGPPNVINWFLNPINYSYLRIIKHSEIEVINHGYKAIKYRYTTYKP